MWKLALLAGGVVALTPALAAADPRADAIARHADADVAELRAQLPGDDAVRCTLGAIYHARGDVPRASVYLLPCADAALPDDLAAPVRRALRELKKQLVDTRLAGVDVLTDPEGAWAEIDALPGDRFRTPQLIYVAAGHHVVTATSAAGVTSTNSIEAKAGAEGPLLIALAAPPPAQPRDGTVDMSEDAASDQESGPPPDVKRGQLRSQHYVDGGTTGGVPQLADPLADGVPATARARAMRIGLRFGGGVFDHSGAGARVGVAAGAELAVPVAPRLAFAARLDWSRRGGTTTSPAMHGLDALGATAGLDVRLVRAAALDVIAGAGPHVAIVLGDAMDASRATLGGAAWLEVPLRATPIVVGARVEQGFTTFAPGARDQAALLELGVDF